MALSFLPYVDQCCFSLDLKIGCIIIAIYAMLCSGYGSASGSIGTCYHPKAVNILRYFSYPRYVASGGLGLSGLALLIGIFLNYPITAKIFVFVAFFVAVFDIVVSIILAGGALWGYFDDLCFEITGALTNIFGAILPCLLLYFSIVVNSYEESM